MRKRAHTFSVIAFQYMQFNENFFSSLSIIAINLIFYLHHFYFIDFKTVDLIFWIKSVITAKFAIIYERAHTFSVIVFQYMQFNEYFFLG